MNFRAIFLSMQRVLGIFSRRENDVVELIKQDPSSLSPFAQIVGGGTAEFGKNRTLS